MTEKLILRIWLLLTVRFVEGVFQCLHYFKILCFRVVDSPCYINHLPNFLKLNKVLSFHMPSGGGFSAGLYMGLRG